MVFVENNLSTGMGETLPDDKSPCVCEKTCGSKGCKRAIKKDLCPGIRKEACVSKLEKTVTDRVEANAWLHSACRGSCLWLNSHGQRVAKSHLAMTASLMPT